MTCNGLMAPCTNCIALSNIVFPNKMVLFTQEKFTQKVISFKLFNSTNSIGNLSSTTLCADDPSHETR